MIDEMVFCYFYFLQALIQIIMLGNKKTGLSKVLPMLIASVLYCAAAVIPFPLPLGLLLTIAVLVLYCRFWLFGIWSAAVLNGVLSAEIMWLSIGIVNSLSVMIIGKPDAEAIKTFGIAIMIVENILPLAVYSVIFSAAQKLLHDKRVEFNSVWIVLFPLILIFGVEIYIVKVIYYSSEIGLANGSDLNVLLLQILGASSVFCILFAYKKCADNFRTEQRLLSFERERKFQNRYADEEKTRRDVAYAIYHDLKNHLLVISELLSKKQYENAAEYSKKLDKLVRESEIRYNTGSPILDVILNKKLSIISEEDVEIQVKVGDIPDAIDETDLCIIFANAIDNAIHALSQISDKNKFLSIATESRGNLFFFKFENNFDGKPFKKGIGLENIGIAAEKYNGTVQITTEKNVFVLKVIMCFSQH